MKPSSLLTTVTAVVSVLAALVMPFVGAVVDHSSHRKTIGSLTAVAVLDTIAGQTGATTVPQEAVAHHTADTQPEGPSLATTAPVTNTQQVELSNSAKNYRTQSPLQSMKGRRASQLIMTRMYLLTATKRQRSRYKKSGHLIFHFSTQRTKPRRTQTDARNLPPPPSQKHWGKPRIASNPGPL